MGGRERGIGGGRKERREERKEEGKEEGRKEGRNEGTKEGRNPSRKGYITHGLSTEQFPVSAYIGCSKNLKDLKGDSPTPAEPPTIPSTRASAWRAKRDPEAKMLSLQSFLRKGVSLGHVGSI